MRGERPAVLGTVWTRQTDAVWDEENLREHFWLLCCHFFCNISWFLLKTDSISSHVYLIWLYILHVLVLDFVTLSDGHFFWHLRCYMLKSWILRCCSLKNISVRHLGHPFIFAAREMWTVVLILMRLSVTPSFPQKWSHVHVKQTILGVEWLQTLLPLSFLSAPPLPHTHTSLTQSRGPYLCLDHASSLVSQVLQGSGNINLFSTCNRPKIGLSSKQWSNPAHICQSLFILGSLWKSAAIENYYIHPSKDLDKSHWLFLDKICKRIFLGPGAIMHSNTPHTGFHVRVVFKNRFRWCPCRQSTNIQECARAHISKLITMIYSRSAAVILMINPCNSCLPSAGISCCWACFGFTSLWS